MHISTFRKPICTAGIDVSLQSNSKITATVCQLYAVSVGAVGYIPSIALFCCLRRRWLQSISFQPLCLDFLVVYLASGSSWSFLYHHQFKTMGKTHNKAMYFFYNKSSFPGFFSSHLFWTVFYQAALQCRFCPKSKSWFSISWPCLSLLHVHRVFLQTN